MIRIIYTNHKPDDILFGLLWILLIIFEVRAEVVSWSLKLSQLKSVENSDMVHHHSEKVQLLFIYKYFIGYLNLHRDDNYSHFNTPPNNYFYYCLSIGADN